MGYYINPADCSKEDFLRKHGVELIPHNVTNFDFSGDYLPVCLVDNGDFTAAGIAYSPAEVKEFMLPRDPRPKQWFAVSRENLKPWYNPTGAF